MKILVLEDEYSIRSFVTINLKREGYEVFEASTGEEAVEVFEKNNDIRLAILDVMLPGIDGFEVLKRLREKSPSIGIIMLTARTHEQDKVLGLEYGADDYISKPFSPTELVARIRSLTRRISLSDAVDYEKDEIKSGHFTLKLSDRKFYKSDKEIELTPKELSLIHI